jgi:hypothetical protein
MSRTIIRLLAVLPFVALIAAPAYAGKHDPLYTPEPIQVPAGKNAEAVKQAIRKALSGREWEMREVGAGHIQGKHTKTSKKDSYTAVVDVKFDAKTIRISYKDSQNLNYDAKDNTIHGTYNKWVKNIEKDIRGNLGAY